MFFNLIKLQETPSFYSFNFPAISELNFLKTIIFYNGYDYYTSARMVASQ